MSIKTGKILPKTFLQTAEEYFLIDTWRTRNADGKNYTFYSARHKSWSRIDIAWITATMIRELQEVDILPSTFANHNPLLLTFNVTRKKTRWRMYNELLRDQDVVAKTKVEIQNFFERNLQPEMPLNTVGDAFKAFLRGWFINQNAWKTK